MFRLTREVRFAIPAAVSTGTSGTNGYAGIPPIEGLAFWMALQVTVEGSPDAQSSYLCNIRDIDQQVRQRGIPAIERLIRPGSFTYGAVLRELRQGLEGALPGVSLACLELHLSPFQSIAVHLSEPTMIRLSQHFEFAAAHRLHNPDLDDASNRDTFGKCNNPHGHGHNYAVKVTLKGTPNPSGTLMPIDEFERTVDTHAIDRLDHKNLNVEVPEFKSVNPSVENIARVIFQMLKTSLKRDNCELASVTVWETPKTWCEYSE